jgi:hypothetical protein
LPGPQGPPGNKGEKGDVGPAGEDGVSVTNVSINSSNHLITTLSDNRKIDAGKLPGGSGGETIDLPNPDWTTTKTNCFTGALIAEPDMYSDGDGRFTYIKPHREETQYTTNCYIEFAVDVGD